MTCQDGTASHTGSVCGGPVASTLTAGSNGFVTIEGVPVMVEDGDMIVPSHLNPPCTPPPYGHTYQVDTWQYTYVTIAGLKPNLVGDYYSGDMTEIDNAGTNGFVGVN